MDTQEKLEELLNQQIAEQLPKIDEDEDYAEEQEVSYVEDGEESDGQ